MERKKTTADTEEGIDNLDDVVRGSQAIKRGTAYGSTSDGISFTDCHTGTTRSHGQAHGRVSSPPCEQFRLLL